jgi:flagellar basal-body rod protein FlgB
VEIGNDLMTRLMERGLQAASLRQRVLANNVANVNTPGFKRSRVDFEDQLSQVLKDGGDADSVQPLVVEETDSIGREDGNNVDIELEMTRMAENQIYYAALTRQLSDQFARLRTVINGGR